VTELVAQTDVVVALIGKREVRRTGTNLEHHDTLDMPSSGPLDQRWTGPWFGLLLGAARASNHEPGGADMPTYVTNPTTGEGVL
jgi:hypothetical protein